MNLRQRIEPMEPEVPYHLLPGYKDHETRTFDDMCIELTKFYNIQTKYKDCVLDEKESNKVILLLIRRSYFRFGAGLKDIDNTPEQWKLKYNAYDAANALRDQALVLLEFVMTAGIRRYSRHGDYLKNLCGNEIEWKNPGTNSLY